ncbi:MAG: hypothetical protein IT326_00570, partial [Anaerolineae bacterium]|nr:hypothetical protein [Anaerolineae bacterium]
SLVGLLADPITVGTSVVWTVIKDYDGGRVYLSGLEAGSGLEQIRLEIGDDPSVLYQIAARGQRVYLMGESLRAYGY